MLSVIKSQVCDTFFDVNNIHGVGLAPPPPLSAAKAGRNHLNKLNTPLGYGSDLAKPYKIMSTGAPAEI